jgi:hypothetical protein
MLCHKLSMQSQSSGVTISGEGEMSYRKRQFSLIGKLRDSVGIMLECVLQVLHFQYRKDQLKTARLGTPFAG